MEMLAASKHGSRIGRERRRRVYAQHANPFCVEHWSFMREQTLYGWPVSPRSASRLVRVPRTY